MYVSFDRPGETGADGSDTGSGPELFEFGANTRPRHLGFKYQWSDLKLGKRIGGIAYCVIEDMASLLIIRMF